MAGTTVYGATSAGQNGNIHTRGDIFRINQKHLLHVSTVPARMSGMQMKLDSPAASSVRLHVRRRPMTGQLSRAMASRLAGISTAPERIELKNTLPERSAMLSDSP